MMSAILVHGDAEGGRPEHRPSWPRQSATGRGYPHTGHAAPLVRHMTSSPTSGNTLRVVKMEEVRFHSKSAPTTGSPEKCHPEIPAFLFDKKTGLPSSPMRISSALSSPLQARGLKAIAQFPHPFTAVESDMKAESQYPDPACRKPGAQAQPGHLIRTTSIDGTDQLEPDLRISIQIRSHSLANNGDRTRKMDCCRLSSQFPADHGSEQQYPPICTRAAAQHALVMT